MSENRADAYPLAYTSLPAFQRDQVAVLAGLGRSRGTDVHRALQRLRDTQIYTSRLYPNFSDLEDRGLVVSEELDGRTNAYELTPDGREHLAAYHAWMAAMLRADGDVTELPDMGPTETDDGTGGAQPTECSGGWTTGGP